MEDFKDAQRLFDAYEKTGGFHNLTDSLDILLEIIQRQGTNAQRAHAFKQRVGRYIDTQLDEILDRSNVYEFVKDLNGGKLAEFLDESLSEKDSSRFVNLMRIKKDYFK
jgi:hypothetical protein